MKRTYAYIVVLINKESEKSFKVAIAATDDILFAKPIREAVYLRLPFLHFEYGKFLYYTRSMRSVCGW